MRKTRESWKGSMPTSVFFVVLCFLAPGNLRAEPIGFELTPSSGALIGAPLEIHGTVRYPGQYTLSTDLAGQTTGAFTIKKAELDPAQAAQGTKVQTVRLLVIPFDVGPQTLPPLPWTLSAASGKQIIQSPPVRIDIAGPNPGKMEEIRDIKPPMSPVLWPFVILGLLLAVLLGTALWELWRRRSRHIQEISAALQDARPPHIAAIEDLQKLRDSDIPAKELYIRMTDILRVYLERRFGIPATVLTTSDLLRQMRQAEMDQRVVSQTREVFERADLVKFAKFLPEPHEKRGDIEESIEIIQSTVPPPEPAAPIAGTHT